MGETAAVEPFQILIKLDENGVMSTIVNDVFIRTGLTAIEVTAGIGGYSIKEHSYPYLSRQGKKSLETEQAEALSQLVPLTEPRSERPGPYL